MAGARKMDEVDLRVAGYSIPETQEFAPLAKPSRHWIISIDPAPRHLAAFADLLGRVANANQDASSEKRGPFLSKTRDVFIGNEQRRNGDGTLARRILPDFSGPSRRR